ncbi:DNA-directed RNA polymerase I subunit RPA43 [Stigmatopora nigra]
MATSQHVAEDPKHVKMSGETLEHCVKTPAVVASSNSGTTVFEVQCVIPSFADASELVSAPYSCLVRNTHRRHVALPPVYLNKKRTGLQGELQAELLKFSPSFQGVPVAYDDIRIVRQYGDIFDDSGYIHVDIEANYILFQPQGGQRLLGKVNKLAASHVGCLVHGCFNASIPKPNLVSMETWRVAGPQIGTELEFEVVALDADATGVLLIRGRLDRTRVQEMLAMAESPELAKRKEAAPDAGDALESVVEDSQKKKKKKDKYKEHTEEEEVVPPLELNESESGSSKKKKKKKDKRKDESEDSINGDEEKEEELQIPVTEAHTDEIEIGSSKKKKKKKDKRKEESEDSVNGDQEKEEPVQIPIMETYTNGIEITSSKKKKKKRDKTKEESEDNENGNEEKEEQVELPVIEIHTNEIEIGSSKKKKKKKDKRKEESEDDIKSEEVKEEQVELPVIETHASDSSGYLSDKPNNKRKREKEPEHELEASSDVEVTKPKKKKKRKSEMD